MGDTMEFTSNYSDMSTDRGFQFEFHCDRCGRDFRTRFQPSATGMATQALNTASGLFGGIFGSVANVSEQVRSAGWQKAHDTALEKAQEEVRPEFIQCPRCQSWVCRKSCWNQKRGLCKNCAPDLGVEASAAQASKSVQEVWEEAQTAEEDKVDKAAWKETVRATCPQCGAPQPANAKFCQECGAKIQSVKHCTECGAKLTPGAKFCPECGTKAQA